MRGHSFQWTPLFDVASRSAAAALILAKKKIEGQLQLFVQLPVLEVSVVPGAVQGGTSCTDVHTMIQK